MKKILKSRLLFFLLGAVIFSSATVFAYSILAPDVGFTPTDSTWKKEDGQSITNVEEAINELHSKMSRSSYVASFYIQSDITVNETKLPNIYVNNDYGYIDNNGDLIITRYGEYQIFANVAHSPTYTTYSTRLKAYLNNELLTDGDDFYYYPDANIGTVSAFNTGGDKVYNVLNTSRTINKNSVINAFINSDGNVSGIRGAYMIIFYNK